ncbi:aminodeoxychorismate synthase component I [Bacteroidales bacterium]
MNKETRQCVRQMNAMGREGRPFLFLIDYEMEQPLVVTLDELDPKQILYEIEGKGNLPPMVFPSKEQVVFECRPPAFDDYQIRFDGVMAHLKKGESCLINLTQPVEVQTNLSLYEIFLRSKARFKLWFDERFVVFSPEPFVRIEAGKIHTYPMKGTLDATLPDATTRLLNDSKELAEHHSSVELLSHDLRKVAKNVRTERFRYVETIETLRGSLLQTSSHISGNLRAGYVGRLGSAIAALLPAGSIAGAPKAASVGIIQRWEGYRRGYYTGIFGRFDGQKLESGVMIRFIEKQHNGLVFKAGGGITVNSTVQREYNELLAKVALPFR